AVRPWLLGSLRARWRCGQPPLPDVPRRAAPPACRDPTRADLATHLPTLAAVPARPWSLGALAQGCSACSRVGRVIVRDVMSPSPLTVDATATLTEAAAQMHARGVGAALVLNGELISGILTERDVLRAVATGEVEGTKVGAWMTHDPETIGPEERPGHAAAILLQGGFRHVPVLENERPVGIVSIRDLMRLAIDDVSGTTV